MQRWVDDPPSWRAAPLLASLTDASGAAPPAVPNWEGFLDALRSFTFNGARTAEFEEGGLRYLVNEFWTSGQRQAHSIHEISYRACFKPQLPEFFISRLTAKGGQVYDPFTGRGTTPVQAALMGRKPIANDVNPLSAILVWPRLNPPPQLAVRARLSGAQVGDGQICGGRGRPARLLPPDDAGPDTRAP